MTKHQYHSTKRSGCDYATEEVGAVSNCYFVRLFHSIWMGTEMIRFPNIQAEMRAWEKRQ